MSKADEILAAIRSFVGEHPELAQDAARAVEDGVAAVTPAARPFSIYDVLRKVIDDGLYGGDAAMAEKAREAVSRHEAEHEAAVAATPAAPAAETGQEN